MSGIDYTKFLGVNEDDQFGKAGGKFGLNQDVRVTSIEYMNKTKDGKPSSRVAFVVKVQDREYFGTIFGMIYGDPTKKEGGLKKGDEDYDDEYVKRIKAALATLKHLVKALGVSDEAIEEEIAKTKPQDFEGLCQVVLSLLPPNYAEIPVDVFLNHGTWTTPEGELRPTFDLPGNMWDKYWIAPHQPGNFKEVRDRNGIQYINEKGEVHKIVKDSRYLDKEYSQPMAGSIPAYQASPSLNSGAASAGTQSASEWD